MAGMRAALHGGSRALSYLLGGVVLLLAAFSAATAQPAAAIAANALELLGGVFLGLLAALVLTTLYCWARLLQQAQSDGASARWREAGLHAANGIATLALTYTLLGISLGIGELAGQELTPDTVQDVIRGLTERFSLAFMTTIIGLPLAAVLRALLSVSTAHTEARTQVAIVPAKQGDR